MSKGVDMTASVILQFIIPALIFIGIVMAGGNYKEKKLGEKNVRPGSTQANTDRRSA